MHHFAQPRKGFTLVELLVVMSLLAILAALVVAFFPNAASSAREARAAQTFQGWLNIAKQRAMRDQKPYGLRLWIREPDGGVYAPPAWNAGTTYVPFEGVMFNNISYRAIPNASPNISRQPSTNPAFWVPTNLVTDCQFIEQPDDYAGGPTSTLTFSISNWSATTSYARMANVKFNGVAYYSLVQANLGQIPATSPTAWKMNSMVVNLSVDATNGNRILQNPFTTNPPSNVADTNVKYWTIQPNDYLQILGSGLMHRVEVILPFNANNLQSLPSKIAVTPPLPDWINAGGSYVMPATGNFRIMRAPRAVGDETLKLPSDTVIDLDTNVILGSPLPQINPFGNSNLGTGFVDIVFSPSGQVISRGVAGANIHLWLRAPTQEQPTNIFRGDPTLVSIFTRTGLVGAYSPNPNIPPGPYDLVK